MAKPKQSRKKTPVRKSSAKPRSKQPKKVTGLPAVATEDTGVPIAVKVVKATGLDTIADEAVPSSPAMPAEIPDDPVITEAPGEPAAAPDTVPSAEDPETDEIIQSNAPAAPLETEAPKRDEPQPTGEPPLSPAEDDAAQPLHKPAQSPGSLSIQINIPAFKRPSLTRVHKLWIQLRPFAVKIRPYLTRKRLAYTGIVTVVLVAALSINHAVMVHRRHLAADRAISAGKLQEAKPSFKPVVPAGHPNLGVPDGIHSRFDASHGSYSFIDAIGGKQFTVSEQQFASTVAAQSALGRAAQSLGAAHQIATKWGTAYLVTIQKYSSQEVVFSANNLLCFIQSPNLLTDDQWVGYLNLLH